MLAALTGDLAEARASLAAIVDPVEASGLSSQGLTFALVADARLALAEGDAVRAATAASRRRAEQALSREIAQALDPAMLEDARAVGARSSRAEAIALIREATSP